MSPDNCLFNVPGYAMLEEMKLYRDAGISNYDILKISTLNAANFFNESKKWGTVESGKDATLILLDKNPLENIENISSVSTTMIKGKLMWEKK
ncbi:MAG: amidohydrolase family protein [Sphingobacteriaceae bacterium]|nr:amidohydrolase family protein [Sphingobacteriaceae bacterium]